MKAKCLIALGGNLGVSSDLFARAMGHLESDGVELLALSSAIGTSPVGQNAGGEFLNAAAVVRTTLSPVELLQSLHRVELCCGRTREIHWGPRTLDLDLIFYGQAVIDVADVIGPHPAMWYRRFVLDPAVEVAADWIHPGLNQSLVSLQRRLLRRPLILQISHCSQSSIANGDTLSSAASTLPQSSLSMVVAEVCRSLAGQGIIARIQHAQIQHAPTDDRDGMGPAGPADFVLSESASDAVDVIFRISPDGCQPMFDGVANLVIHDKSIVEHRVAEGLPRNSQPPHSDGFMIDVWLPDSWRSADKPVDVCLVESHTQTVVQLVRAMKA